MLRGALGLWLLPVGLLGMSLYFYRLRKGKHNLSEASFEEVTFPYLLTRVKEAINEMTRSNLHDLGLSEEAYKRRLNKRTALSYALKNCSYGSVLDKQYVKDFIADILRDRYVKRTNVDRVMSFMQASFLTTTDRFDLLLFHYKRRFGYDALHELIQAYKLDALKNLIEDGQTASYIITKEEIDRIYYTELPSFNYEEKLAIISQRIFQMYKGFGVIDEIRDMNIDGISGGVSGVPPSMAGTKISLDGELPLSHDAVWIFYQGKSIHLSFLSFGSEMELRRVCQNIYRYNRAGQLSESSGYKVNEMKDGSRVVVVRPSFSESWAFFIRKFHIANVTLEELIKDPGCDLPIGLITYLVKGARITAVTGSQGSGKTTLLMAMVRHIYATLTLRVQEMAFELHLRGVYPMRNILTFKETATISGQAGLDVQKKTDGSVNILGEVATDEVAVWMLQMAQVASLFTLFTHHAKTVSDLCLSLRNALLKCDVFRDEKVALDQVVKVLDFDIHLERDVGGKRRISRITELVATGQGDHFEARDIMRFVEGSYRIDQPITRNSQIAMLSHMTPDDQISFRRFLAIHYGPEAVS